MKKWAVLTAMLLICLLAGCQKQAQRAPVSIVTATDLHFAGRDTHDYTGTFRLDSESNGSGKQMQYLDDILDAFLWQMQVQKPDYVLLTGDVTYIGAKESHLALAQKLSQLTQAGIQVLVVPGNHDICGESYVFPNGEPEEAPSVTPEEFRQIYADCGYTGGISYDKNSLSYVVDTGKGTWIFMLDTNFQYGTNLGRLSEDTVAWLRTQLKRCKRAGAYPLLAGHHNLLVHNEMFQFGYVLGNSDDVQSLLTQSGGSLYLSGHLHSQHIAEETGITDIAGGSFAVYPHRYGKLTVNGGQWTYIAQATEVSKYAAQAGIQDENLLQYEDFGFQFFYDRAYEQAKGILSAQVKDEDLLHRLCDLSARANVYYFGGTPSMIDRGDLEVLRDAAADTSWLAYLETIFACTEDSLSCSST